jgi:hypothetical protein
LKTDNEAASYEQNPVEQHARWVLEFAAARRALSGWQKKGTEIDKEFRNEAEKQGEFDTRLPLFASDIQTIIAMLYGQVPRTDVSRRFGDSGDDLGRVAGEILERILNTDISRDSDTYAVALRCVLMDYFLPGFGLARCRYVEGEVKKTEIYPAELHHETGEVVTEAITEDSWPKEDVEVDYVHWKDWLWGPAKVLHMVPWWSHETEMTRAQLVERFGDIGKDVPLAKRKDGSEDPWSRAKVNEIYEKATRRVYWFCENHPRMLDMQDDPLQLEGFYPFPEPLVANLTTSKVVPRPYYALHRDQYQQINILMSSIRELVSSIKVSGACDKEAHEQLQRIMGPEGRNKLIPVANWMKFVDSGGLRGLIDWFPNEPIVQTIAVLQQQLQAEIDLLHQATGFSDIMRGEATQAGATATEQRVKSRTGSVRVQRLQDEIARFATGLLSIKAQIIAKHFSPETIKARANVRFMPEADQLLADEAIALLKSDISCYRIEVKPEAVALADFAAMKQERGEFLETITTYFQALAPIAQQMPDGLEELLEIGKWVAAGIRGSSQIEGVFDRMIGKAKEAAQRAKENPQAPPTDPKVKAEEMKMQTAQFNAQAKMNQEQFKLQAELTKGQAEVQNDAMREENQRQSNVKEAAQRQLISNTMRPVRPGGFP